MTASSSASPGVRRSCSALSACSRSNWRRCSLERRGGRWRGCGSCASVAGMPARPIARALVDRRAGRRCRSCAARRCPSTGQIETKPGRFSFSVPRPYSDPRAHRRAESRLVEPRVQEERRRAVGDAFGVHARGGSTGRRRAWRSPGTGPRPSWPRLAVLAELPERLHHALRRPACRCWRTCGRRRTAASCRRRVSSRGL